MTGSISWIVFNQRKPGQSIEPYMTLGQISCHGCQQPILVLTDKNGNPYANCNNRHPESTSSCGCGYAWGTPQRRLIKKQWREQKNAKREEKNSTAQAVYTQSANAASGGGEQAGGGGENAGAEQQPTKSSGWFL
ncbi:MAG: hypothetical protein HQL69_20475 [Magnetococcales bacterium]|nr:hypothetical protein [Magnetococcales bacterium]